MITEILTNEYSEGKRISTQIVTYTKADDIATLGRMQLTLASQLNRMYELPEDIDTSVILGEIDELYREIAVQQGIVNGYVKDEPSDGRE